MINKFRAWDEKDREICDVISLDWKHEIIEVSNGYAIWPRDFFEVELMQSTGLKDINGTEIYEGDILKTSIKNLVVEWVPKGACWGIGCHYLFHYYETSEVIGNKYQHPELLEG